jgi:RNA polymerase sigma factor (sigma-70 family)
MLANPPRSSVRGPDLETVKQDQAMVGRINDGCVESWQDFVRRYSDLIYHVLWRKLIAEDEEEIHTVFVDTLEQLYEKNLKQYTGKSSLTTWVVLVARSNAVDYLRRKRGRRRYPKGYDKLSDFARKVFELYVIEGLGFDGLIHALRWQGESFEVDDIARAVMDIENNVDPRYLRRIELDHEARRTGASSGAELRFILEARAHYENKKTGEHPEQSLIQKEADELKNRVTELWQNLPAREKTLIDLRFKSGWSAAKIAGFLGLDGQRQVYRLTDSIVNKMRQMLCGGTGGRRLPSTEKSGSKKV